MNMHRLGRGSKLVAAHLPFELVYLESSTNRSEATKRELQIKKLNRTKKLELIKK
jgi:putative endonuclease